MKTMTYSGEIRKENSAWGGFDTLMLTQADGYRLDLVARLNEAVLNYGNKVSVRYWTARTRQDKESIQKGAWMKIFGSLDVEHNAEEYSYSEYTRGVEYETMLNVDQHNLYAELSSHEGRFVWLEVDFLDAPEKGQS